MDQLQVSARFPRIDPAHLAEFKSVAAELVALARREPDVHSFALFLSADGTIAEAREIYASSNAVLAHLGAGGAMVGRLAELGGGIEIECFGTPSPELLAASAAMSPKVFSYVDGK